SPDSPINLYRSAPARRAIIRHRQELCRASITLQRGQCAAISEGVIHVRFFRAIKTLAGLLAVIFIGLTVTLFIVFPRVVNMLADSLGTGAENATHWIPAIVIDIVLLIL